MTVTPGAVAATPPSRLLAAEIRAQAARKGVSLRRLALVLGVSQPWVTRRVSVGGDVDITFEELAKMAEALDTNAERLMRDAGLLPRLDSNQQPSGERKAQVIDLSKRRKPDTGKERSPQAPLRPLTRLDDHR